jgi:RNA-directed DNA polymerase
LKAKYYIRYVDDFIILHKSKNQLIFYKERIKNFIQEDLNLELHSQKSKIIPLSKGINFVGFKNFNYYILPRKRNKRKMMKRVKQFKEGNLSYSTLMESFQGWQAYVKWTNSFHLRKSILKEIQKSKSINY